MVRLTTCPICHQPLAQVDGSMPRTDPFCSVRCQQADLYRWFSGKYAIVENLSQEQLAQKMLQAEDSDEGPAPEVES